MTRQPASDLGIIYGSFQGPRSLGSFSEHQDAGAQKA